MSEKESWVKIAEHIDRLPKPLRVGMTVGALSKEEIEKVAMQQRQIQEKQAAASSIPEPMRVGMRIGLMSKDELEKLAQEKNVGVCCRLA